MLNGKRYCHIIDPRTGYPSQNTQSVTVLVPPQPLNQTQAGVLSDVASKPIFIESTQNRGKAAEILGIQNFMVIDDNANIFVSNSFIKKLNWLSPNVKFTTIQ
jgi:thiamine biosynthesis lipoprotein